MSIIKSKLPLTLVSQYLPLQYAAIRDGRLKNDPRDIVLDGVSQVLRHYADACNPAVSKTAKNFN